MSYQGLLRVGALPDPHLTQILCARQGPQLSHARLQVRVPKTLNRVDENDGNGTNPRNCFSELDYVNSN